LDARIRAPLHGYELRQPHDATAQALALRHREVARDRALWRGLAIAEQWITLAGQSGEFGVRRPRVLQELELPLGVDFDALITAMQKLIDDYVVPVWGMPAKLVKSTGFVRGDWAMVFLDNADQAGALA
jgi:hypothetical protein